MLDAVKIGETNKVLARLGKIISMEKERNLVAAEIAFNADKRLRTEYSLPGNERIDGIVAVGYPGSEGTKIPPRGPAKVIWLQHTGHGRQRRRCAAS